MLFNLQKIAQLLLAWCALAIVFPRLGEAKDDIIYEYDIITQKKGQTFEKALQAGKLTPEQANLMMALPVLREAKGDRQFRIIYAVNSGKRQMREVKVTRGNRMGNFVLAEVKGKPKFVSQASQIPEGKLKSVPKLTSLGSAVRLLSPEESLFSLRVTQAKGQGLNEALSPLKLSQIQLAIINGGKFLKSALSERQLTLFFAGSEQHKLLRGMTVIRGKNRVDFIVSQKGGNFILENLKLIGKDKRDGILATFSRAKNLGNFSTQSQATGKQAKRSVTQVKSRGNVVDSGNYRLYRIRQNKGQSLSSAMKGFALSSIQRTLMGKIPVVARTKSTRYFYPLFEVKGKRQYLKAVRVVRGKNVAEFVLVKHNNQWVWADRRGKITTSGGSGGFLRYPLSFRRVSSGFDLRRRHPITRRIRPHKGTDFSAKHGTPVWAPADGVVSFAGRQRGFGIVLVIEHGKGYKTKYAHLSRILKGVRKGTRVKKRQVIARVGNTGLSTGSHLHYEVHVNGRPRNPMTVRLPGGGGGKTLSSAKLASAKYLPQIRRML